MNAGGTHAGRGNGVGVGTARAATEVQKAALLAKSQVSLWIDTYDDIFSDFDPRPYGQRALSDDFADHEFYTRMARTEIVFEPY